MGRVNVFISLQTQTLESVGSAWRNKKALSDQLEQRLIYVFADHKCIKCNISITVITQSVGTDRPLQTVQTQIRCCSMRHLIRVYIVCHTYSNFLDKSRSSRMYYSKCPKNLDTFSIFFWIKFCFLCSCFFKCLMEWQCRPWSDCSFRSSLIWVCTFCIWHFVRNFGVRNLRTFPVFQILGQIW